ncbi:MBL fold metallo-hydrolase [Roseibacterium sp. SDUM158016]|jgi:7,8-dihydropterin-6-yl-methyl-4-(beta-D-ribofuranosyl)aminobenzene 5'-phosphate synthase|uniref:MBL fold metallo-hydrolase n=1 Tax=Roseicyclus sediminis TaxID=2980997 RepID=UPI0021CF0DB2|nr:MBL fold metallo-hydrolase [Roseibacterium sp. SDUM158016]MCU4655157.1 MBL fold metallo-hydrolase [Roseibacterium sp. SDUM158016]
MNVMHPIEAPIIDSLAVRVVVDSRYERFLPKAEHPFVRIDHVGSIPGHHRSTFACEWGLSLHLVTEASGIRARYLLDFGYTPEVLIRNFELLGLEPKRLDALILSHGHRDHFGGLEQFVGVFQSDFQPDVNLVVGGETVFREKWIRGAGGEILSWGSVNRAAIEACNVPALCCHKPHVMSGAFTTGYIERQTFETVSGGSMVEDYDHFSEQENAGKLVFDDHPDEHAACFILKDRGLVVITACGHVGLINTVKAAMAVSNVQKLHAVVGGFHLGTAPDDYIEHTIDALEDLQPDVVIPMHCSGERFITGMRRRMPEQLVTSNVGTQFTFGA